jgi:hypothetical protein
LLNFWHADWVVQGYDLSCCRCFQVFDSGLNSLLIYNDFSLSIWNLMSYLAIKASCIGPNDLLFFYTSTNFITVILQFHVILSGKKYLIYVPITWFLLIIDISNLIFESANQLRTRNVGIIYHWFSMSS